jgi:hypothetical protein
MRLKMKWRNLDPEEIAEVEEDEGETKHACGNGRELETEIKRNAVTKTRKTRRKETKKKLEEWKQGSKRPLPMQRTLRRRTT